MPNPITNSQVHQLVYQHITKVLEANKVPHHINTLWSWGPDLEHDPIGSIELTKHNHRIKIIIRDDTINIERYDGHHFYTHTTMELSDPTSLDPEVILTLIEP